MRPKLYPKLGNQRRLKATTERNCVVCGKRAEVLQDIEYTWFRGDDETRPICRDVQCKRKLIEMERA